MTSTKQLKDAVDEAFESMLCRPNVEGMTDCLVCIHPNKSGWKAGEPEIHQDDCPRQILRVAMTALEAKLATTQIEALRWERIDALGSLSYWYLQSTKDAKEYAAAWESRLAELDEALKALTT